MEELRFKYSGLFQNVDIRMYKSAESSAGYTLTADADIKLPILKKVYTTSTEFEGGVWRAQMPLHEKGSRGWRVERKESHGNAYDPVSFFLEIHNQGWNEPTVFLAIGDKVIELDVIALNSGYEIKRRDKEQRLIVKKNEHGICALEIPIPVLGNIVIKRV